MSQEGGIASEYCKYHFADDRNGVFHYIIIANAGGWCHTQDSKLQYDTIVFPTNREHYRKVYVPPTSTYRQKRLVQSVAVYALDVAYTWIDASLHLRDR